MRLSVQELEPIPEEEKKKSQEFSEQTEALEESLVQLNDYRIVDFDPEKTTMYLGEEIEVTGKFQVSEWWKWWNGWHAVPGGGVFLMVNGEPTAYTTGLADDGSFRTSYTAKIVGTQNIWAEGHKAPIVAGLGEKSPEELYEELKDWIVAESTRIPVRVIEPVDGVDGGAEAPPTFWEALTEFNTDALWNYHREKVIGLGFGVLLLMAVSR